jgi:hypothetical protein
MQTLAKFIVLNSRVLIQSGNDDWMLSDLPTICEERLRLLREYSEAASSYSTSVHEMAALVSSGQEVRANEARRSCRTTWDEAERSRLALYRHEADHNCARSVNVRNISET